MRKIVLLAILASVTCFTQAQKNFYIHKDGGVSVGGPVSLINEITFSDDNTLTNLKMADGQTFSYLVNSIDSFSVGVSTRAVQIVYNGTSASVINPLAFEGVSVTVNGCDVEVNSTSSEELEYVLSGNATDGSFKMYSATKYILTLNGVSLTNNDGPAINSQSSKKVTVNLVDGTVNALMDGAVYTPCGIEDMKGCMFGEGQFVFEGGEGTLNVTSKNNHAICSDDHLIIKNGTINVLSAANDGMHANDYVKVSGGVVNIDNTVGDAIDAGEGYILIEGGKMNLNIASVDKKGMKCDSTFTMNGGEVVITIPSNSSHGIKAGSEMTFNGGILTETVAGNGAKGIKAVGNLIINDGIIVMNVTGTTLVSGSDKSYCIGIKCDNDFTQYDGSVKLTCTGVASRGLSADGVVSKKGGTFETITSGTESIAIITDGNFKMEEGTLISRCTGLSSQCIKARQLITFDGGNIDLTVGGNSSKGIKASDNLLVNNGIFTITTTGGVVVSDYDPSYCTAIKCDGDYIQTGGNLTIITSGQAGKGISVDGDATFSGGSLTVNTTGAGGYYRTVSGYDTYSSSCITVDGDLFIENGTFTLKSTGTGGKCIKVDGSAIFGDETHSPEIQATTTGSMVKYSNSVKSSSKAIKSMGNFTINNGNFIINTAKDGAEGLESKKVLTINGGTIVANCYDDCINASTNITINGGSVYCYASNNDAIDSNGTFTMTGGIVLANGASSPEEGIDCDNNTFTISGGILVTLGGSMNGSPSTPTVSTAKQNTILCNGLNVTQNTYLNISSSDGVNVLTYKIPRTLNSASMLFTSPHFTKGTMYSVKSGGSVAGYSSEWQGLYLDGSYNSGSELATFTINSTYTTSGNSSGGGGWPGGGGGGRP